MKRCMCVYLNHAPSPFYLKKNYDVFLIVISSLLYALLYFFSFVGVVSSYRCCIPANGEERTLLEGCSWDHFCTWAHCPSRPPRPRPTITRPPSLSPTGAWPSKRPAPPPCGTNSSSDIHHLPVYTIPGDREERKLSTRLLRVVESVWEGRERCARNPTLLHYHFLSVGTE